MKVIRHNDSNGDYRYISFSNTFISRIGIKRILRRLPEAMEIGKPPLFGECEFYKFKVNSVEFIVNEDWGGSSVFDILSSKPNSKELEDVAKYIEQTRLDPISITMWLVLLSPVIYSIYNWGV